MKLPAMLPGGLTGIQRLIRMDTTGVQVRRVPECCEMQICLMNACPETAKLFHFKRRKEENDK